MRSKMKRKSMQHYEYFSSFWPNQKFYLYTANDKRKYQLPECDNTTNTTKLNFLYSVDRCFSFRELNLYLSTIRLHLYTFSELSSDKFGKLKLEIGHFFSSSEQQQQQSQQGGVFGMDFCLWRWTLPSTYSYLSTVPPNFFYGTTVSIARIQHLAIRSLGVVRCVRTPSFVGSPVLTDKQTNTLLNML